VPGRQPEQRCHRWGRLWNRLVIGGETPRHQPCCVFGPLCRSGKAGGLQGNGAASNKALSFGGLKSAGGEPEEGETGTGPDVR